MDQPDITSRQPEKYHGEWSDWMAHAPTQPNLPRVTDIPNLTEPPRQTRSNFPEDDVFARMINRSQQRRSIRKWAPVLLGSLSAVALMTVAVVAFRAGPPQPEAVVSTDIAAPAAGPADPCPPERVGNEIQGNGAGSTDSGPAAIFAFQHAYYVERSGVKARALVAADSTAVSPADMIQRGIDSVPAGTAHCVTVAPGAFVGQYLVTVTEFRPGAAPVTYNAQLVSTARAGERTVITGITRAE